jgi:hypothetical protein
MTLLYQRAATFRKPLSREQFELMCDQAARHSITCRGYIRGVLTRLCRWLDRTGALGTLRPECEPGRGNVQRLVVVLYRLVEERCLCDFKVEEVLNSFSPGADSPSKQDEY